MGTKEQELENEQPKPQPANEGHQGIQGAQGDVGGTDPDNEDETP